MKRPCIFVIEHGVVSESGTHDELLARPGGTYRRLAEMQFGAQASTALT